MVSRESKTGHIVEDVQADVLGWDDGIVVEFAAFYGILNVEEIAEVPAWFSYPS